MRAHSHTRITSDMDKLITAAVDPLASVSLGKCLAPGHFAGPCEAQCAMMLIGAQHALVKTVKNGDWLTFITRLAQPIAFRSSFSLPPPSGRMHLFGDVGMQCVGVIFDRRALDTSRALCWPSGYFAKTEFHLHEEPDGNVRLTGGRASQLISLDDLAQQQLREHEERQDDEHQEEPPLYNEINLPLRGPRGLCAVFLRSNAASDLRIAMGLRDLLQHCFPKLPPLPLLRLTPALGVAIVSRQEQLEALRRAPERALRGSIDASPRLPVNALAFGDCLTVGESLALHSAHGITHRSLHTALEALASSALLATHVTRALCAAAMVDNVASAREIVRTAAPLLLRPLLMTSAKGGMSLAARAARAGVAADEKDLEVMDIREYGDDSREYGDDSREYGDDSRDYGDDEEQQVLEEDKEDKEEMDDEETLPTEASDSSDAPNRGADERRVSARVDLMLASVSTLRRICTAERSQGMLVALGAQITIGEFVTGRTAQRLSAACRWLHEWCENARSGPCSPRTLVFLMTSWNEARKVDGNSDWLSFLSGKAVSNRLAFHSQLLELLRAQQQGDGVQYVTQLHELVKRLRKPCLRLRILQQVLGLDTRFSRDTVYGVICLALDVLEGMARGGGGGGGGGSGGGVGGSGSDANEVDGARVGAECSGGTGGDARTGSCVLNLGLDSYDEATRLEAEALFQERNVLPAGQSALTSTAGLSTLAQRPSDPVGEHSRRNRVLYYYR